MSAHAGVHPDLLDERDPLRGPFTGALLLHVGVIGGVALYSWIASQTPRFGAQNAGGNTIGVEAVTAIPIVHHGEPNPLTNDTQSEVPQQPVKELKDQVKEVTPPDAIKLRTKKEKKRPAKDNTERQKYRPFNQLEPNQLTSKSAPQISNPMFTSAPGSGQIGAGKDNLLGDQFPAYAAQIQAILTQHWHTENLDARIHNAPPVDIVFDLMKDGSVRNVRLLERSGYLLLDNSVQRAVLDSKFPPLPAAFKRDTASVDFTFELKR